MCSRRGRARTSARSTSLLVSAPLAPGLWRKVRSPSLRSSTSEAEVSASHVRTPSVSSPREAASVRSAWPRRSRPTQPHRAARTPSRARAVAVERAQPPVASCTESTRFTTPCSGTPSTGDAIASATMIPAQSTSAFEAGLDCSSGVIPGAILFLSLGYQGGELRPPLGRSGFARGILGRSGLQPGPASGLSGTLPDAPPDLSQQPGAVLVAPLVVRFGAVPFVRHSHLPRPSVSGSGVRRRVTQRATVGRRS